MERRDVKTSTLRTPRVEPVATGQRRAEVLTKAVVSVAARLGLGQGQLAKAIGVSPATASRMWAGTSLLDDESKPFELGALLVRIFRSLDALVGGNETHVREWFHAQNEHLGGAPDRLVLTVEGMTNVARYLDAVRGAQ